MLKNLHPEEFEKNPGIVNTTAIILQDLYMSPEIIMDHKPLTIATIVWVFVLEKIKKKTLKNLSKNNFLKFSFWSFKIIHLNYKVISITLNAYGIKINDNDWISTLYSFQSERFQRLKNKILIEIYG